MLSKAFEWERVIHPNPTDEMVTRRKAMVANVISNFDVGDDVENMFRLVSAALTGLSPSIASDVELGTLFAETIKKQHEAFSSLLSENAQELQLVACLAVGELLSRKADDADSAESQVTLAALVLSTASLMTNADGVHLRTIHDALTQTAGDIVSCTAIIARKRPGYSSTAFDQSMAAADVTTFWNQLKPLLKTAFDALERASAIDRDELEVLWWLYNGESSTFRKKFSDMGAYEVALAAPIELADRSLCPAPSSLTSIAQGLVARVPGKQAAGGKSLTSIVELWADFIRAMLPGVDTVKDLAIRWPKILPVTWIANKVAESGVSQGWEQEFASRSGLIANMKITPQALADHVFAERTAQRLLFAFTGE
jgi:hypothetical protein